MTTRMLIDARHPEETRVAVLQGNRIEEFDFESAEHKQIKGNIYLAKVTRVEPSLQAAFVDFGGNRHGFLAFSEIHPDYYQIPKEDREALLAAEAEQAEEEAALRASEGDDDDDDALGAGYHSDDLDDGGGVVEVDTSDKEQVSTIEAGHVEHSFEDGETRVDELDEADRDGADRDGADRDRDGAEDDERDDNGPRGRGRGRGRQGRPRSKEADELRAKRMALRRRYKIQDVIQRRQVLLVQVVKEERGNKGAALTTYLSLAGRYCVLMPNSSHGGGISRKISSAADRKRLKAIIGELDLPRTMGCIVRTAGLARTKPEIKRDFDYLARLWDEIREGTLKSSAPALIHSDSDLVKRAIRDIYNRDVEEVVVEGEEGYRAARAFMKLLMPSHVRRVKAYSDPVPLFQRHGAEDQLTAMYDPVVQLRSGGYIVINPTEALVSIDINSGRSTKEYGIEATALNTNLEAAREIARQLRLRDMAGLVVIDFIDMEHNSNVRKIEKAMKDALRNDRARIQVGRISSFGLMEMSRQRLRTGVLEATTRMCPHCDGSGLVRTASSAGLSALRLIEDEAAKGRGTIISLFASAEASIYLLNAKRGDLSEIEQRYGVRVEVIPEGENEGAKMRVTSNGPRPESRPRFAPIVAEDEDEAALADDAEFEDDFESDESAEDDPDASRASEADRDGEGGNRRKRRKRRRAGRSRDRRDEPAGLDPLAADVENETETEAGAEQAEVASEEETGDATQTKRRRRGRRRRGRDRGEEADGASSPGEELDEATADGAEEPVSSDAEPELGAEFVIAADALPAPVEPIAAEAEGPSPPRGRRRKTDAAESEPEPASAAVKTPRRRRKSDAAAADAAVAADVGSDVAAGALAAAAEPAAPPRKRRRKSDADVAPQAADAANDRPPMAVAPSQEELPIPELNGDPIVTETEVGAPSVATEAMASDAEEAGEPRRGWWQRTFGN